MKHYTVRWVERVGDEMVRFKTAGLFASKAAAARHARASAAISSRTALYIKVTQEGASK